MVQNRRLFRLKSIPEQLHYYFITCAVIALWALSVPARKAFYRFVENLSNADGIFDITIRLVPFYIAYAGSAIIDNIFIGLGKTGYNMVNSPIINLGYYGVFYVLTLTHAINFDMNTASSGNINAYRTVRESGVCSSGYFFAIFRGFFPKLLYNQIESKKEVSRWTNRS